MFKILTAILSLIIGVLLGYSLGVWGLPFAFFVGIGLGYVGVYLDETR